MSDALPGLRRKLVPRRAGARLDDLSPLRPVVPVFDARQVYCPVDLYTLTVLHQLAANYLSTIKFSARSGLVGYDPEGMAHVMYTMSLAQAAIARGEELARQRN